MTFLASPFTDEESKAYTGDTTHSLSLPWAVGNQWPSQVPKLGGPCVVTGSQAFGPRNYFGVGRASSENPHLPAWLTPKLLESCQGGEQHFWAPRQDLCSVGRVRMQAASQLLFARYCAKHLPHLISPLSACSVSLER